MPTTATVTTMMKLEALATVSSRVRSTVCRAGGGVHAPGQRSQGVVLQSDMGATKRWGADGVQVCSFEGCGDGG